MCWGIGILLASLFENPSVLNASKLAAHRSRENFRFPDPFPVRSHPPYYKQKYPQGVFLFIKAGLIGCVRNCELEEACRGTTDIEPICARNGDASRLIIARFWLYPKVDRGCL